MAEKNTFRLNLPKDRQLELYRVELADGTTVDRALEELKPHPSTIPAVPRG